MVAVNGGLFILSFFPPFLPLLLLPTLTLFPPTSSHSFDLTLCPSVAPLSLALIYFVSLISLESPGEIELRGTSSTPAFQQSQVCVSSNPTPFSLPPLRQTQSYTGRRLHGLVSGNLKISIRDQSRCMMVFPVNIVPKRPCMHPGGGINSPGAQLCKGPPYIRPLPSFRRTAADVPSSKSHLPLLLLLARSAEIITAGWAFLFMLRSRPLLDNHR